MNDPSLLYVSDDPEFFPTHGVLFRAPLSGDGSGSVARLLFDHVNSTPQTMRVLVGIANLDNAPASVDVLGATAGPAQGFMTVGHLATQRFLEAHELGGEVQTITVPAGQTAVLADFPSVAPGPAVEAGKRGVACVAGIFDLQPPGRTRYELRVLACAPQHGMDVFDTIGDAAPDGVYRRGVFDISRSVDAQTEIQVDGSEVDIGPDEHGTAPHYPRAPIDPYAAAARQADERKGNDPAKFDRLKGEFGVLKRFAYTIPAGTSASLLHRAGGGAATATYLVDGRRLTANVVPVGRDRSLVNALAAPPDRDRTVEVLAMAEINSTMPLCLSVVENTVALADGTIGPHISAA